MNRHDRRAHVIEESLLGQSEGGATLGDDAAMAVTAAAGLAHVERHVVLAPVGEVEVRGEHRRRHVAQLGTDDIPRAGIELLLDPVLRELDDATGHVLGLVAVVTEDGPEPGALLAKLGDVPVVVERVEVLLAGHAHVQVVGHLADRLGARIEVWFENAHDLEDVRAECRDFADGVPIRVLLGDELAPYRLDCLVGVELVVQCHSILLLSGWKTALGTDTTEQSGRAVFYKAEVWHPSGKAFQWHGASHRAPTICRCYHLFYERLLGLNRASTRGKIRMVRGAFLGTAA